MPPMHFLIFLLIPAYIFAVAALLRAVLMAIDGGGARGWWRFPLWMAFAMPTFVGSIVALIALVIYAATGHSPMAPL